ncbi:unnamed protein product [Ixodes pacificus]
MASQSRDGNNAGSSTPNTLPTRSDSSQIMHLAIQALERCLEELIDKDRSLNANKADEFLLRFLRFDRLDPKRAFRTLKLYYVNRHKERDLFRNLLPSQLGHVFLRNLMVLLPERDPSGRLVLVLRPGSWNPSQVPFLDVARALLLCFEYAMRRSSAQLRGLCMIFDMDGWSYDHMTNVPASRIKALSGVLAGYPIKNRRWDIVKQSYIFNVFFKMLTPFLDATALSKIHFHGWDLHKLHHRFPVKMLPEELGGTRGPLSSAEFYERLRAKEASFAEEFRYGIATEE